MEEPSISVRRYCRAPRTEVFAAFSEIHRLEAWYTPGPDWFINVEFQDFRAGGHYRIRFGPPDESATYTESGTYLEIEAPRYLEFTARLTESGRLIAETRCRVDLHESHLGTEVLVRESGCADADREARIAGWEMTLDNLVRHVAHRDA